MFIWIIMSFDVQTCSNENDQTSRWHNFKAWLTILIYLRHPWGTILQIFNKISSITFANRFSVFVINFALYLAHSLLHPSTNFTSPIPEINVYRSQLAQFNPNTGSIQQNHVLPTQLGIAGTARPSVILPQHRSLVVITSAWLGLIVLLIDLVSPGGNPATIAKLVGCLHFRTNHYRSAEPFPQLHYFLWVNPFNGCIRQLTATSGSRVVGESEPAREDSSVALRKNWVNPIQRLEDQPSNLDCWLFLDPRRRIWVTSSKF